MSVRWLVGDCRETLAGLDAGSVQACITSPPYFGLRDYGTPPLVWGGIEHEHEWTVLPSIRKNGNTDETYATKQASNAGAVLAIAQGATCACGAWLGSLGLEPSPDFYVEHIVECFRHVRRVLRDDGTCWINLGDSYAGSGKGPSNSVQSNASQIGPSAIRKRNPAQYANGQAPTQWISIPGGLKEKDLMMMPFRVAMALQADGWYLRSVIPWVKRAAMPESVSDRPSTSVEYVFLLAKSGRYHYDAEAVRVPNTDSNVSRLAAQHQHGTTISSEKVPAALHLDDPHYAQVKYRGLPGVGTTMGGFSRSGRNRRNSDWFMESWQGLMLDEEDEPLALVVNPTGFKQAHFATFPPRLVEPMVKASTSEKGQCPECGAPWARVTTEVDTGKRQKMADGWDTGGGAHGTIHRNGRESGRVGVPVMANVTTGWRPSCAHTSEPVPCVVLDPFSGSGTVGLVADRLGRDAVLCELSETYTPMGTARIRNDAPMFAEVIGGGESVPIEPIHDKQGALGKRTYSGFNARWDAREAAD